MMSMSGMSMSMSMSGTPTPTMSGMPMGTSTGSSHPMSMPESTMMGMDSMAMVFFTATNTPLFSYAWAPTNTGQYAGTCIFLIVFAAVFRALLALRSRFDDVLAIVRHRRSPGVSYTTPAAEKRSIAPWRASEAVMLAALDVVLAGVGYLLMLAVMTMNVGYFLSVLSGVFVGSTIFGRFTETVGSCT